MQNTFRRQKEQECELKKGVGMYTVHKCMCGRVVGCFEGRKLLEVFLLLLGWITGDVFAKMGTLEERFYHLYMLTGRHIQTGGYGAKEANTLNGDQEVR